MSRALPQDLQSDYVRHVSKSVVRQFNASSKKVSAGITSRYDKRVTDTVRSEIRWEPSAALDRVVVPIMGQLNAPGRF